MKQAITYLLSFEPYVLLPIIIFILAMVFRINIKTSIKSALSLGIGFVGIFMTFDYFVELIRPIISTIIERTGLELNVLDVGWPPLSAISWSFNLAPLLLSIFILINLVMLVGKFTKTVNIDIWNYWHVIFLGLLIYEVTGSHVLTLVISVINFILLLKIAEWIAPLINEYMGMEGICIPHLGGIIHYPLALVGNLILDKIPVINKIEADPKTIQKKIGILGEPMVMGFILGAGLSIAAGFELRGILTVAIRFSAVIYILPKMCTILGESLIPISEGMKEFMQAKLPNMGETYIGLDVAILFGDSSTLVATLFLMPTAIILAIILPKVNFIPLGDWTNLLVPMALVTVATKGNVIRSYIIGVPIIIGNLYAATWFAPMMTNMISKYGGDVVHTDGLVTSFLDGGHLYRIWLTMVFQKNLIAIGLIPVVIGLIYYTWKFTKIKSAKIKVNG